MLNNARKGNNFILIIPLSLFQLKNKKLGKDFEIENIK